MNWNRDTNLSRFPTYLPYIAVVLVSASILWMSTTRRGNDTVDFTLRQVRGGSFHLRSQPAHPVLLAFLQMVPDTADTPSRSQAVFLLSMAQQYGPHGLTVVVIDASALVNLRSPDHTALVNASYDWQMNFPLLEDVRNQIARRFRIKQVPTTILLAPNGRVEKRWQGLTRPAVLASGIEKLTGGPLGRLPAL